MTPAPDSRWAAAKPSNWKPPEAFDSPRGGQANRAEIRVQGVAAGWANGDPSARRVSIGKGQLDKLAQDGCSSNPFGMARTAWQPAQDPPRDSAYFVKLIRNVRIASSLGTRYVTTSTIEPLSPGAIETSR